MGIILDVRVVLILMVFAIFIGLMIAKKLPTTLALSTLGVIVAVITGVPFLRAPEADEQTIMGFVTDQGASRLAGTTIATIFSGMFAKVIQKQGIPDTIIQKTAELARGKPYAIASVLTAAAALIFSAIGDAGPVIMVSTIVIPLMLSAGIPGITAASLILLRISTGNLFNVSSYQFYVNTIGMDMEIVKSGSLITGISSMVAIIPYIMLNVNRENTRSPWIMPAEKTEKKVGISTLLAPIVPILLIFLFRFSVELDLLMAIICTILVTEPKQIIRIASGSFMEGIQDVSGVVVLMIGIEILLNGVSAEETAALTQPLIQVIMPSSSLAYVVLFTLLSLLALYRGSLNMYGLGSGLADITMAAGTLSPATIDMVLHATGVVQGVSDPTNTQNVIVAGFTEVDVDAILESTLPYIVLITLGTLIYTACFVF